MPYQGCKHIPLKSYFIIIMLNTFYFNRLFPYSLNYHPNDIKSLNMEKFFYILKQQIVKFRYYAKKSGD